MKRSAPPRRKTPLRRGKPIRERNPERLARLRAEQFGPQAALCRFLPCVGCHRRPCDPHHVVKRGMGGVKGKDYHTVPACRDCHPVADLGPAIFYERFGVDLRAEMRRLSRLVYGTDEMHGRNEQ